MCGALGPGREEERKERGGERDTARRVHLQLRSGALEETPRRIWPLYPYISFRRLHGGELDTLQQERLHGPAHRPGFGFERKSRLLQFRVHHLTVLPHSFLKHI